MSENTIQPTIRSYETQDETGWLQCRVLAFLDTAYFDDVQRKKERYASPAIELVADLNGRIVGLLDIECETEPKAVCSPVEGSSQGPAGMIWNIAVHPEYRRRGIARALLNEAKDLAALDSIVRLEAWTRDDPFVNDWYRNQGFNQIEKYYHIYPTQEEIRKTGNLSIETKDCYPVEAYYHYLGEDKDFLSNFGRVHECRRFNLKLNQSAGGGA